MRAACNAKFANCKSPIGLKTEAVLGKMPPSSEPKLKRARTKADANAEAVAKSTAAKAKSTKSTPASSAAKRRSSSQSKVASMSITEVMLAQANKKQKKGK